MNQRQIDLALLAGIGVLLVTILVLALSAAPMSASGDIRDPVEVAQERAAEDEPQAPVADADGDAAEARVEPADAAAPPAGEAQGSEADRTGANEETADERAQVADPAGEQPVNQAADPAAEGATEGAAGGAPAEEVSLERVGFAFVTGSMGACGVPLEPWQHVAVSRDLLERYGCGATVNLTLEDEVAGRRQVTARIADTMGAEIQNTVNIFVAQDEPALEYGVTTGALSASAP